MLTGLSPDTAREVDDCAPIGVVGVRVPFADGPADDTDGRFWLLAFAIGVRRLVERFKISLPLTTRLSFDFRRSLVIISVCVSAARGE